MEVIKMFDPWLIAVVVGMIVLVVLAYFFAGGEEKPANDQAKRPTERRESPRKAA